MNGTVDVRFQELFKLGYLVCRVPQVVTDAIDEEIRPMISQNFIGADPYNYDLAGAIQHEYNLKKCTPLLNSMVSAVAATYWNHWGIFDKAKKKHWIRYNETNGNYDVWANFQKKYEHNPLHTHSGILSFVIWHQIPYDIEEEKKLSHLNRGNTGVAGVFTFNFPNFLEKGGVSQHTIEVNKSREHDMIIFPSFLQHSVYPFYTSDDFRISISGNIIHD